LDLSVLFRQWQGLSDTRKARGKRYPLSLLLSIATLAKLAGHHCPQAITDWARLRMRPLCKLLRVCRHVMPSLRTWNRVFALTIDPQEMEDRVSAFLRQSLPKGPPQPEDCWIAMDGKTLRGTIRLGRSAGVHLLAIYRPTQGIVLAQAEIGRKANEISAASPLLAQVDLQGLVLTGDAMFTQRELSLQIVAAGGHYLWKVKQNQSELFEAISTLFTPQPVTPGWGQVPTDFTTARTVEKGHGRIEERTITVSSMLKGYSDWPHLAQVFKLESRTIERATGKVKHRVRYGVTSLPATVANANYLLALVRAHWRIESGLHYRRDVTLEEDKTRVCTGHAPHVHAVLNNVVLALLHRRRPNNTAAAQREVTYLLEQAIAAMART